MNENRFQSQRAHTRVKFSPLRTSCQLACLTPQSPATQSINSYVSPPTYEPDRSMSPTVIYPDVRANDPDNVFTAGAANAHLALDTIAWLVDGKPITEVWTEGEDADYTIDKTASDTRGSLKVYKNLAASEKAVLKFKASFLDWRTGISYNVESDELALTCTDKGEDAVSCSVDKPLIQYDPLFDDLLLYDYKVARGITVQGTRADYVSAKCYEQTVNVLFTSGTREQVTLPDGVTMQLVRLGESTPLTAGSTSNPELLASSYPTIKFDMRLISKADYAVRFVKSGKVIASATIGLHTSTSMPTMGRPRRNADLIPAMDVYENSLILNLEDRMVEYPELFYLIQWFTQAKYNDNGTWKYAKELTWQRGEHVRAIVADLGIGVTYNDSYFDLWFELDAHPARQLVADENGEILTDENGEILID